MIRHRLDPYSVPKDKAPLYINEPWLIDESIRGLAVRHAEPENETDNIRVYIPLDLNRNAIIRRLKWVISEYGDVTDQNEAQYSFAINHLISQVEIYDQIWYVRHMPEAAKHSLEAIELVREMITLLESITDGGIGGFPFDSVKQLRDNYL